MYDVTMPLGLALLPLALIPLLAYSQKPLAYSSLAILPPDRLSGFLDAALRLLGAACIVAIALGISGLYRAEQAVERIGQGAHTMILIDSSGSMDMPFAAGNDNRSRASVWGTYTSKGQVARQLLAEYAAKRPQDMFALFVFSGNPIAIVPLTSKQAVIQAAIEAGTIERGLASTDLGSGLIQALEFFEGKAFTGSRVIMLVSDGAARLTEPIQDQVRHLLEKHRVTLYWIYLRGKFARGLESGIANETAAQIAPEQLVHEFFSGMKLPYRAFSAEDPAALQQAIDEVDQLQNLPIRYVDVIPRRDLAPWCYGAALALLLVLLAAQAAELSRWH